jgi:3-phosphoshikimate 1-carboxyvinyltransferase
VNNVLLEKLDSVQSVKLTIPSSKSISNRALILAAQAKGDFALAGDFEADDIHLMIEALRGLGISIEETAQGLQIKNDLSWKKSSDELELFLGNSGTSLRFLSSLVPLRKGSTLLTGNKRMSERPISDMVDALVQLGVVVDYKKKNAYPPLRYTLEKQIESLTHIKGSTSSQYLTSLLLSAASYPLGMDIHIDGDLISKSYVDLTLSLLKQWGVEVSETEDGYHIPMQTIVPQDMSIEGDASAAVYWWAFGYLHGVDVEFSNLDENSIQGDMKFVDLLKKIKKHRSGLFEVDMNSMPDASMMLMTLATVLKFPVKIINIESLRVKETDRIHAMSVELKKLGLDVRTGDDWIQVDSYGFTNPNTVISIDTYDDHRIAMCFAILGTKTGNIEVNDPDCVKKTYPNFWRDLKGVMTNL